MPGKAPTLRDHPAAGLFPPMDRGEFEALKEDIEAHGLLEPIALYAKKILDGRHRYRACQQLGIASKTVDVTARLNGSSPEEYVVSKNLHRRHLNASQRSIVAAEIKKRLKTRHGGDRSKGANVPPCPEGKRRDRAAALMDVAPRTVDHGSKVLERGTPELVDAVKRGEIAVSKAAKIAELPKEQQKRAVAGGKKATARAGKKKQRYWVSVGFWKMLDHLFGMVEGIEHQFGSIRDMMESPHWDHAKDDVLIEIFPSLASRLGKMAEETVPIARKNLAERKRKLDGGNNQ